MKKQVLDRVAGNGLINRRHLLGMGLGGMGMAVSGAVLGQDATGSLEIPAWSRQPGPGASAHGSRSRHVDHLQRMAGTPDPIYPGGGASRSPCNICGALSRPIICTSNAITPVYRT